MTSPYPFAHEYICNSLEGYAMKNKRKIRYEYPDGIYLYDATDCAYVWFVLDKVGIEVLLPCHIQA
jgi:hypothetical protein